MHITLRRVLFWFFLVAFFIVGTLLIVKTQGFVVDWENLKLVKTGGIFVKILPSDSEILLDGKPYKKPVSLWNTGILIKDLVPRTYTVTVKKEGRETWEKTLTVEPGLVASASFIRLFEKEPKEHPLSPKTVEDFWLVKGGIVELAAGKLHFGEIQIRGNEVVEADPDRNEIITKDTDNNLFFISLGGPETAVNLRELFASLARGKGILKTGVRAESVMLHPFSPTGVIVRYGTGVFVMDVKKLELQKIIEHGGKGALTKASNEVFFVSATSSSVYNLLLGTASEIPTPQIAPASFSLNRSGSLFFFKDLKGTLFVFDRTAVSSTEIAKNVDNFSVSGEDRLVIVQNDGHVLFYYLKDSEGDLKTPKGKSVSFPLPKKFRVEDAASAIWTPRAPQYLFFVKNGTFIGSEADTRPPVNAYAFLEGVAKAAERDGKFVVLHKDGTLTEVSFEF